MSNFMSSNAKLSDEKKKKKISIFGSLETKTTQVIKQQDIDTHWNQLTFAINSYKKKSIIRDT